MRCTTVNQTREFLSTNVHFQLQKLVQFCFCLRRTAMHLCQCCMVATTFVGYCKCSIVQICNERCTLRCRNNFHLNLAIVRLFFNTNVIFIVFKLVLSCFGAQFQCVILIHVLFHTCTAAYSCRCNRCPIVLCARCNMQICILTQFLMHNCIVQILCHAFCTIIICIALCCMFSICSAC